jgi:small-conductance mechanosensitive channel
MSVKEWVLTNSSLLVLAAAILVARSLLRPERIDRWLDWGLGPLGWARDISPLVHVIFRWGSTLILVFILADVAGLTDGVRAALGALGLAGLVVGFAGQHVIQNILAGIMILLDGDITIGDVIEVAGTRGEILEVELRSTLVRQEDGVVVIVPNTVLLNTVVKNTTLTPERIGTSPLRARATIASNQAVG